MSSINFSIRIQGDSEGFVTFECPYCRSEFKLQADEYQDEENSVEEIFCPYCGLAKNHSEFLSSEVKEQIQIMAHNYIADELSKTFGKMARSLNHKNSLIKMTYKPLKKVSTKELKVKDTTETKFSCRTCGHQVKVLYCAGSAKVFCPYCGVDI